MHSAERAQALETLLEDFKLLKRSFMLPNASATLPHITASQWVTLVFIAQRGVCTVKDIALHLHMTSSAATQLVNTLVKHKYVIKKVDPGDRRAVSLTLSKDMERHFKRTKEHILKNFLKIFECLTDREFKHYCELNKKITQGVLASYQHKSNDLDICQL
jgi:DNA-binding MarR family transcriptional regulator